MRPIDDDEREEYRIQKIERDRTRMPFERDAMRRHVDAYFAKKHPGRVDAPLPAHEKMEDGK